ncbi:MAG: hypothetical protein AAF708_02460 [Deinococcota bacterium]
MKSSWVPWGAVIALILLFFLLVINGTISFDGPDMSLSGNDIRPPNVRSFRINGVAEGDVIAVIDSVILTPAELEDPTSPVENNVIRFSANISDENRIERVELRLYRLLPRPNRPMRYETFELIAPYRFDWDASSAPNGLYGVELQVVDNNQNEALVYPNVQLALLRFGAVGSQTLTPQAPAQASPQVQATPARAVQSQTLPQANSSTSSPTSSPQAEPSEGSPSVTPTPGSPEAITSGNNIRRRDLVFTVLATLFFAILVQAGRLFASKSSSDHYVEDYTLSR